MQRVNLIASLSLLTEALLYIVTRYSLLVARYLLFVVRYPPWVASHGSSSHRTRSIDPPSLPLPLCSRSGRGRLDFPRRRSSCLGSVETRRDRSLFVFGAENNSCCGRECHAGAYVRACVRSCVYNLHANAMRCNATRRNAIRWDDAMTRR